MMQDIRYVLRGLRRSPAFCAAAVLSLAIGIGANTSIFSVVSALLLRPLPYQDADRLVILWNRSPGIGIAEDWFSTAQYFDIKNGHTGFEDVAIAIGANWNLTGDGEPERVGTLRVSSNLLPMLGVHPVLGAAFTTDDDRPGRSGRALLGHGTWVRRYGGDRAVIGRTLVLNGQPYEIAGVLPESFDLPREVVPTLGGAEQAEIVLPLPLSADAARIRNGEDYNLVGKLKPEVTVAAAQAEMDTITARLRSEHPNVYPAAGGLTFSIVPLHEQVVGNVRPYLMVLTFAVVLVLLIACANVANLFLSRALGRENEFAVRGAMGASRARILRQLLTESLILSAGGGLVGLLLTGWMVAAIRTIGTRSVPRLPEIAIDVPVLLFTLAVSLVAGVLFGFAPAWRMSRAALNTQLAESSRRASGAGAVWGRRAGLRRLLVIGELALSVMLLIGAGLLIRSFNNLQYINPGFNPSNVLTLELTMTGRKYAQPERVLETYRELWTRLAALPGVTAAGGVSMLPLSQMFAWGPIVLEDRQLPGGVSFINVDQRTVAGSYFDVMQIPLQRGRLFNEHDTRDTPRVVVIDDAMARLLWPDEDPIGKRLRRGGMDADPNAPWLTVVGVVGRIKQYTLDETDSRIAMYHPHTQTAGRALNIVARTTSDPAAVAAAAVATVRSLDADLPVYNVRTMQSRVDESFARRRFVTWLLTMFAALAVMLAGIGVYGVMAYLISQGTRDIGVRVALGATGARIMAMVLRQGLTIAAWGLGIGVGGALLLGGVLRTLLFGVTATDPLTYVAVSALLAATALVGVYVPARRAAGVDPVTALRTE
ncbi:MAG TPA: ABC transporter permease [Vicinamibacterales bacterium]|nr:ABC transporter permease [Vicinamibacterales bacterium]